jgi:AraC-like DNA-binding protein
MVTNRQVEVAVLNPDLLAGLELKVLAIQRTLVGRWWDFKNVVSPFSRLWLVLAGRGAVRHHGRRFALEPGCLHLIPPFTPHDCSCSGNMDHFHLHFISRLRTGGDLLSLLDHPFQVTNAWGMRDCFERLESLHPGCRLPCFDPAREEYRAYSIAAELSDERNMLLGDWFEKNALLSLLLTPFLKSAKPHEGVHARSTRLFLAVQQYIHQHMQEPISLADLARVADLRPTYFSDRFLQLVGERPLKYLMRCRLERAQFLLLTSPAPVKQVANEVGIPDQAYFTRAFKRFWQISPSQYRATHPA